MSMAVLLSDGLVLLLAMLLRLLKGDMNPLLTLCHSFGKLLATGRS
jgi:hypothetical protein